MDSGPTQAAMDSEDQAQFRSRMGTGIISSTELPEVMTAAEVAAFLRVNVKTVYESVKAGQLPGRRVGKRLVFWRDALLDWLRSNECELSSKRGK